MFKHLISTTLAVLASACSVDELCKRIRINNRMHVFLGAIRRSGAMRKIGGQMMSGVIRLVGIALVFTMQTEAKPFHIVQSGKSIPIVLDQNDATVVGIAGKALSGDIKLITGIQPELVTSFPTDAPGAILIGTLGQSKLIDYLVSQKMIPGEALRSQWETYLLQTVDIPQAGGTVLVIAGSDPRGTAFGVFELSKRLGVSPWVYWADVLPAKSEELSVSIDQTIMGPPSVKYRGIFLNDEDWGLQPWAAKNIDTDIRDMGPKTYAKIFELMLRLKANYIWPAMHPCTKAFFYYKDNAKVAAQYAIVVGSSHCEPMLRNNVDEWKKNFREEYGKEPGPWRYDINKDDINRYWEDRVEEVAQDRVDAVFTVGMRGIHDSGMPGGGSTKGKIKLMSEVLSDQRQLLAEHYGKAPSEISQIFCPYKEVLQLYQKGAEIPDDVTLVWADDNHGYIRKLSNPDEQKRSGRSGIYYHLSYWGAPADYLWLSSMSPALISYEMSKAFAYGADRHWIFNVGDIKPAELETEFAMDLAWDVEKWAPNHALAYVQAWAERTFGKAYAAEIASIKADYYRLAASGKPEHLHKLTFSPKETEERLASYQEIAEKAYALNERIPEHLKDAYFQLVLYPVVGAAKMNAKHLYAKMGDAGKARSAYADIKALTGIYNNEIAGGKWNQMMSMAPRNRPVFGMPKINATPAGRSDEPEPLASIEVSDLVLHSKDLYLIPGLGIEEKALSRLNYSGESYPLDGLDKAPQASTELKLPAGQRRIKLFCVPTHAIHEGRDLRAGISLGAGDFKMVDVNFPSQSEVWSKNVIQGYSTAEVAFDLTTSSIYELRIALLDPGLVISKIVIY